MNRLPAALVLLGFLLAARPVLAQDEATIKGAFVMCGPQRVLIACDDLVKMPDLSNVVRASAYVTRAGTLLRLGRMDEAKADVEKALALDPTNAVALEARTLLQQAKPATGEKLVLEACLHQTDSNARLKACDALVTSQASDKAREAAALEMRAKASVDAGRFNEALADLDKADQLAPDRQDAALHRIQALTYAGRYSAALESARTALGKSGGTDADLLHSEANLLYLTGSREEAVSAYEKVYRLVPQAVMAKFWSAIIRLELHKDSADDLRALLRHPMMSPLGAAIIRLRLHEGTEADVLKEARVSGPQAPGIAYFNIGHDAWLRGEVPTARRALQQAVDSGSGEQAEYQAAKLLLSRLSAN